MATAKLCVRNRSSERGCRNKVILCKLYKAKDTASRPSSTANNGLASTFDKAVCCSSTAPPKTPREKVRRFLLDARWREEEEEEEEEKLHLQILSGTGTGALDRLVLHSANIGPATARMMSP
jgi:hypothetical protein